MTKVQLNSKNYSFYLLLIHEAAILDFEVGGGELNSQLHLLTKGSLIPSSILEGGIIWIYTKLHTVINISPLKLPDCFSSRSVNYSLRIQQKIMK